MNAQKTFGAFNYLVKGAFKPLRFYDTQSLVINHTVGNPNQGHMSQPGVIWWVSILSMNFVRVSSLAFIVADEESALWWYLT